MHMPPRAFVTDRTHEVFAAAHVLADQLGHADTTPVHLTLCMLQQEQNMAAQILLYSCQLPRAILQAELTARLPSPGTPRSSAHALAWSAGDDQMLGLAEIEAEELGEKHVGCEHLLLAFLRGSTTEPAQVLASHGVSRDRVRQDIQRIHDGTMIWAGPAA